MTSKEKWEIALGCVSLVLLAYFYASQLDSIGANDGIKHRWKWWQERRRMREAAELELRKAVARTFYEAECAVTGIEP